MARGEGSSSGDRVGKVSPVSGKQSPLLVSSGRPRCSLGSDLLPLVSHQSSESSGLGSVAQPPPSVPVGSTTETSGGPELSDSLSSGGVVAQAPLRKVKVSGIFCRFVPGLGWSLDWQCGYLVGQQQYLERSCPC